MKRFIPVILAVFVLGIALGAGGFAAWEHLRPEPLFSFDPGGVRYIEIEGRDSFSGEKGMGIKIFERERVDYIIGLLNGFQSQSQEDFDTSRRCGTQLSLHTADGDITWVYFDTYSDGRPDAVSVAHDGGGCTRYETSPGYFGELKKMPGTDPRDLYPEMEGD